MIRGVSGDTRAKTVTERVFLFILVYVSDAVLKKRGKQPKKLGNVCAHYRRTSSPKCHDRTLFAFFIIEAACAKFRFGASIDVRIKLWRALRDRPITRRRAYVRCIVKSEFYDMLRRRGRQFYQLQVDYEEEPSKGRLLVGGGEGLNDPAEEFERKEAYTNLVNRIAELILRLPPRQQQAMFCVLAWEADDALLKRLGLDSVEAKKRFLPTTPHEAQTLRVYTSIARKKLRELIKHDPGRHQSL